MALYGQKNDHQRGPKKKTSQGHGLRKKGSFKKGGRKPYVGQGK